LGGRGEDHFSSLSADDVWITLPVTKSPEEDHLLCEGKASSHMQFRRQVGEMEVLKQRKVSDAGCASLGKIGKRASSFAGILLSDVFFARNLSCEWEW